MSEMTNEDLMAELKKMAEANKKKSVVGKVMENGGGAVAGAYVGAAVVAPALVALGGILAAPLTGGASLGATAVAGATLLGIGGTAYVGHRMSKDMD